MTIELRAYQSEAVDAWFENDSRGIFQMATGTGKTYTAIGALDRLTTEQDTPLLVIIGVPYTHLAKQWQMSLHDWGYQSTLIYGSDNREWKAELSRRLADLQIGIRDLEIVISTHATMSSEYYREAVADIDTDRLLIADEVHRLGAPHYKSALLDEFSARLGLSATPKRHFDDEGTEFLLDYFDGVVYEFSLKDAIPEYLVPYDYHPVIVELTQEELSEYRQLSQKLGVLLAQQEDDAESVDDEQIQRLQFKRANLIKSAENKYDALESVLDAIEAEHLLVYTNHKQIDEVQQRLNQRGIRQHRFTAEEDDSQRQQLLQRFDTGELNALVAMKCLDEGVDVPSTKQAIMMSNSGNPMQFVQRRGRLLRRHPGKEAATIYDFLVIPTETPDSELVKSEERLLQTEIRRFEEFASTARNEQQARNKIRPIRSHYEIDVTQHDEHQDQSQEESD